jgi:aspartyl aminopeptidase
MSAQSFVQFVTEGASPFHAVSAAKKRLLEFGFVEVNERATWNNVLKPGGKYFFTRNQSALVAFGIGKLYVNFSP